jgi:hypothetical protein
MRCFDRSQADRYAQGLLSAAEAERFETHLTTCAACAALLESLEPALPEAARLPRALEPAEDLWPGISSRIGVRAGRIALPRWILAAAAVVLVAVSSGVTALVLRQPAPPPVPASGALAALEAQYLGAAAELDSALSLARTRLTPATVATIERNLAVIDSALAESRRALAGDPGNVTLEQLVLAAWRQKMDFLRRATALASES